jgi:nucleoside-diphosphate-sugar epimerase
MITQESKIFITGATGFVGSYIVKKIFNEGFKNITCLKRNTSSLVMLTELADRLNWVEGDMLDLPFLEDVLFDYDIIIHAAADVTFSTKNKKRVIETAMTGTANLVNAALFCNVPKFIHISSIAALGRKKLIDHVDEKVLFSHSPYDTTYGLSKFLAEQEAWRGHAEGLQMTVLCPSMILGASDWYSSSPKLFTKIFKGLKYYPLGTNGWVDVRDVAEAVFKAVSQDHNGKRYIISAQNLKYQDVFQKIAAQMNVVPPKQPITNFKGNIFWRLEKLRCWFTGGEPLYTKETFMSTSVASIYDNSKSIDELGMRYTVIDKTISDCVNAFNESQKSGLNYGTFY